MFFKISRNSQECTCTGVCFNNIAGLCRKLYREKTPAQMFSCKFCEIVKFSFFTGHPGATAFELLLASRTI